jgi:hypothetical protein
MTAASGIPTKYSLYWAQNAGGAYVRTPPFTSSATPGAASFNDGFVPTNMTLGGIPPFGQDENGVLRLETQWSQWVQMGGPITYDATFQTAISGYPKGALVQSASIFGLFWFSTAENNGDNPDSGPSSKWLPVQAALLPATGAQLQLASSTQLKLAPVNGGFLWVNGFNYPVGASVTIGNGGLASTPTLYYVYAKVAAGAVALDTPSTTGYSIGANGIPVKSTDATKTLVGMVETGTDGTSHFLQQDGGYLVRSYFQRGLVRSRTNFTASHTNSSNVAFVEIDTSIRNSILVWTGENVRFAIGGTTTTSSPNVITSIGFDSATPELESSMANGVSSINVSGIKTGLSEGLHYATVLGALITGSGTATWQGGAAPLQSGAGLSPVTLTLGFGI